jgi:hypothetical protein
LTKIERLNRPEPELVVSSSQSLLLSYFISSKMSSSSSDFQSELLKRLDLISQQLSALSSSSTSKSSKTSEKKVRKPRKADAKENPWITFTTQVRGWLKEAIEAGDAPKDAAGIKCQQFCKFLKETHGDETYSLNSEQVLAAHATWTPPESDKKPKPAPSAPAPKPAPSAPAPTSAKKKEKFIKLNGGVGHVWNTETNQIYLANDDKSRGEYLGIFDPSTKKIDDSVPE